MNTIQGDIAKLGALVDGKSTYQRFVESQGIPQIEAFHIDDMNALELTRWERKGGSGVYLRLEGTEDTNDTYVCEIPPGGKLNPDRHMYEEMVYILKGRGATKVWLDGKEPVTFEWNEGSLFSIPLNANYQHFNGSGTEPARYVAVTTAPLVINLYHDLDFVFNCDFQFTSRFSGEGDYFNGEGQMYGVRLWDTNFISNVKTFPLVPRAERGIDFNVRLELAHGALGAHISEFPVGRYKKGHRHGPGAHVIIVKGQGYSLLWREGESPKRYDWKPGAVIVPPDQVFHQHFNTGTEPARYLAIRWNSRKYPVFKLYSGDRSVKEGGNQIDFEDQDPMIHRMFEEELAKVGIQSQMDEFKNGRSS